MRKNYFSVNLKATVAYCLLVEAVFLFLGGTYSCVFSWRFCHFDCRTGTSKQMQFKPSSLALQGLEFVIFLLNTVILLFIDQAAKNFGEKNYCSRVMKMLFSTKNSGKGQLKSQQICFAYSRSKREKSDKLQVINRYAEIVAPLQVINHYMSAQAKW